MFSVYSGRDYTCPYILCYLSELVVLEPSRTDLYIEAKVVGHAHWCARLTAGKDVGHVGEYPRSRTIGTV